MEEAKILVEQGAKELNLIAEDTNQWGQDRRDGRNLAHLLRELKEIDGLHWIRILYAYPSYFHDELIEEISNNPKVCKYIDMPLQHISNLTLLEMNRPPKDHTVDLLKKLRERIPGLALRTTFICGFPGERAGDHEELVEFVKAFKFERMGAFTYSEEDGTTAAEYEGQIDYDVRQARRDELVSIQQQVGEDWARGMLGKDIDVLVDGITEDGEIFGRTQWDAPDIDNIVFLEQGESDKQLEVGQIRKCHVTGRSLFDLEAVTID